MIALDTVVVLVLAVAAVSLLGRGRSGVRRSQLQAALRDRAALQATLDAVEELLLPERGTPRADVVLDRIRSDERARRALERPAHGDL